MLSGPQKAILALAVFLLPFLLICCSGLPEWVSRAASVAIFHAAVAGGFLWLGLGRSGTLIRPGSKLADMRFAGHRLVIERAMRVVLLAFALFFVATQSIPFVMDLRDFAGAEGPQIVTATAQASGGVPFFKQSVRLLRGMTVDPESYTYLYFLRRIETGRVYEMMLAPRSRVILQARLAGRQQQ